MFKNFENGMINVNFKIKMKDGLEKMKQKKQEDINIRLFLNNLLNKTNKY